MTKADDGTSDDLVVLLMVVETYLHGPDPVYERAATMGRMLPPGLDYLDSWVEAGTRRRCFQLMRTDDPALVDVWMERWSDLVAFEVVEVVSSGEASSAYGGVRP